MNTIDKKINGLGLVGSRRVQQRGGANSEAEILVQLPGVDDPARMKQLLKTQAVLELDEVRGGPFAFGGRSAGEQRRDSAARFADLSGASAAAGAPPEFWILARTPVVKGRDLRDARPQQSAQNGRLGDGVRADAGCGEALRAIHGGEHREPAGDRAG